MIKAILVDDESIARKNLQLMLQQHCAGAVTVVGEANDIETAYELIVTTQPSLVFLDVEMGQQTGFDLLAKFEQPNFRCIFVTAFDQYALNAIKFCALDYVLKPIGFKELQIAVQRATNALQDAEKANMQNLITVLKSPLQKTNKISIPTVNGFKLMPVAKILYMESEQNYTYIHCDTTEKIISTKALGAYEEILSEYTFFRIHHSYIINKDFVTDYIKGDGGEVILNSTKSLPVSRRKKAEFLEWLQR